MSSLGCLRSLLIIVIATSFGCISSDAQSRPSRATRATESAALTLPATTAAAEGVHARIIVKFRAALAAQFEQTQPSANRMVAADMAANPDLSAFAARHPVRSLSPLHPSIVAAKMQRHVSADQLAGEIRQTYAARAQRLNAPFNPPDLSRTYVVELEDSANVTEELEQLRLDPDVEYAEADKLVSINLSTNDPYLNSYGSWGQSYFDLWGLKAISAPSAWDTARGQGIVVAVVDTGLDYNHSDIAANVWTNAREIPGNGIDDDHNGYVDDVRGWNFSYSNNNVLDDFGHGTHVAGTIAAVGNNGFGIIGVAWEAKIMPVKALDSGGYGFDSGFANAIVYAANNGADVINNSWGGSGTSQAVSDAVSYAHSLGAVVVAAAGNSGSDVRDHYPANVPDAITVAATNPDNSIASFSNFGPKIDVAAPGVDILSLRASGTSMGTLVGTQYTRASGTSMAAPHVSGAAALILSQHPDYSNEQVREVLRASGTDLGSVGFDTHFGYGGLNVFAAMAVTSPLEAKIQNVQYGATPISPITFTGNARGAGFAKYTLEYGSGQAPTSWTLIGTSLTPVSGGVLGQLDPSLIVDGVYSVRLTVYNASGGRFADAAQVSINTLSILSPVPASNRMAATTFKPGKLISIIGTASGAGFQEFRLEWASGSSPSFGWQTSGISLTGGGVAPVANGQLGTWDTSGIKQAGYYTIRLTEDSIHSSQVSTVVYLEPDLLSTAWPVWLDQGPNWIVSGLIPMMRTDLTIEFAASTPGFATGVGALWTISMDGTARKTLLPNWGTTAGPTVGDVDGAQGEEIVTADWDAVRVYHEGAPPVTLPQSTASIFMRNPIVLEDLDGDQQKEIIAIGNSFTNPAANLYAWKGNGELVSTHYPILIADNNDSLLGALDIPRLLVGDFEGNGTKQIVTLEGLNSTSYTARLFAGDGTPMSWKFPVLTGAPRTMIAADLDHNGTLEIILVSLLGTQGTVHVFQPDGTERAGWPVSVPSQGQYDLTFLAAGDLDRDSREEIVLALNSALYLFNSNGTKFSSAWPLHVGGLVGYGAPVIGDVDGDGQQEIVTTSFASGDGYQPKLLAIRSNGSIARSWLMTGMNGRGPDNYATPSIGDFNQDGITDIALTYPLDTASNSAPSLATVISTGAPFATTNDWPLPFHDAGNTAVLTRRIERPNITYSPDNLDFGAVTTGNSSPIQRVTIQNLGPGTFKIDSVTIGGSSAQDYTAAVESTVTVQRQARGDASSTSIESSSDSNSIAPGSSTVVNVTFSPTARGPRPATLLIADNATGSPHRIPLAGIGTAAGIQLDPTTLSFKWQGLNVPSTPLTVNISNTGDGPLTVSSLSITGANVADFTVIPTATPFTVAPGASKQINVTFTPSDIGNRSAMLTVTHNAGSGKSVVNFTGIGQKIATTVQISPSLLEFGTLSGYPLYLNVSNAGGQNLVINEIDITGPNASDFSIDAPTTPITISPFTTRSFSVTMKTTDPPGPRSATLTFFDNAVGTPHQVALTGKRQGTAVLSVSPSAVEFGTQNVGKTSAPSTLTISNLGDDDLRVAIEGFVGTNAGDFSVSPADELITVAPKASTKVTLRFAPTAGGLRSATLRLFSNTTSSPNSISVTGTGTVPVLTTTAPGDFGSVPMTTTSPAKTAVLTNTGTGVMTVSALAIAGANAGDFAIVSPPTLPAVIQPGASLNFSVTFTPTATGTRSASVSIADDAAGSPHSIALSGTGAPNGPAISFSPPSVVFGNQQVNTSSAATNLTVSNTGNQPLIITNIQLAGANAGDFAFGNAVLPLTIVAGGSVMLPVTFTPSGSGGRSAQLIFTHNGVGGSQSIALAGTGIGAGQIAASPSSLVFADQTMGSTSPAKIVTVTNVGSQSTTITEVQLNGTDSASFKIVNPPVLPASVPANGTITLSVAFAPARMAAGMAATLTVISSNAGVSSVSLTGNGIQNSGGGSIGLNTTALSFPATNLNTASAAKPIIINSTGSANLVISSVTISGTNASEFTFVGPVAPFTISPQSSTVLSVTFKPTDGGARNATMTIVDNAPGSPHTIALSGIGNGGASGPAISFVPSSITFADQQVNTTSAATNLTVNNTGNQALVISNIQLMGANTSEFGVFSPALPATVNAGASIVIQVTFKPTVTGSRTAQLSFTDNATGGTQSVSLAGAGTSGKITAAPSSLLFADQASGTASPSKLVTITNSGNQATLITGLQISGVNANSFTIASAPALPATLPAGGTMTAGVVFTPKSAAPGLSAALTITSSNAGSAAVALSGNGVQLSSANISLNTTSLTFPDTSVNTSASSKPVIINSTGNGNLVISSVTITGANAGDFTLIGPTAPFTVSPQSSTVLSVAFKPTSTGTRSAIITIVDNAPGGPHTVLLNGTGH